MEPHSCLPPTRAPAASFASTEKANRAAATARIRMGLFGESAHRAFQALDRRRVHSPSHDFPEYADRLAVRPDLLGLGVEPDGPGVHLQHALQPHRAGLVVRILDRASRLQDLVRAHGRVADEDELIVVAVLVHDVGGAGALGMPPAVVFPHVIVQAVVEVEMLEMLEFGLGRGEQLLAEPDVVVHRAADVEEHEDLHRVVALRPHVQVEPAGVPSGLVDRGVEVELFRRAFARELAQPSQRHLDVARAELDRIVQVAVFALVPYLYGAAAARAVLADANPLRVVAVGAERGGARGADPLVAALVPAFLLLEAFLERLHEFFPAAQRLDHRLFLRRQIQLGVPEEPFERHVEFDSGDRLDSLEIFAESAVELVEILLVLDQSRARQVVELVDRGRDDVFLHRLEQRQPLHDRDRDLVVLELDEEAGEHGPHPSPLPHAGEGAGARYLDCLDMKMSRSNRCTSCSFLSSAPWRGGTMVLRSLLRSASGGMSSASRSFSQSRSSEVEGFFFRPGTSRTSKNASSASRKSDFFSPGKCTPTIFSIVSLSGKRM